MTVLGIIIGVFGLGGSEFIVIGVVLLLLFGGKKIPELMKGLGQGINEFKKAKHDTDTKTNDFSKKE